MWLYIGSVIASFIGVFIRVFQQKNIQHGHKRLAFATSYAYALADVAVISFIVKGGWWIALSSGTGAAFAVVAAMSFHERIVK